MGERARAAPPVMGATLTSVQVPEDILDRVVDEVNTLNDETPKVRTNGRTGVAPGLVFNLDSKLASAALSDTDLSGDGGAHNDEIATCTVWRGAPPPHTHDDASCLKCTAHEHEHKTTTKPLTKAVLEGALAPLPKDSVYRVKGFLRLADDGVQILNWAFSRFDLTLASVGVLPDDSDVKLTVMGHPGEVKRYAARLADALDAQIW